MGEPSDGRHNTDGTASTAVKDEALGPLVARPQDVMVLIRDPINRERVNNALRSAGFGVVLPRQILEWAASRRPHVLLITDDSERTASVRAAVAGVAPESASVVLVAEASAARCRHLLETCLAVLPEDAAEGDLLAAVSAVSRYLACLPAAAVGALTGSPGVRPAFTEVEVGWLRDLADGAKVAALARAAGYSQREMYRVLADLYERLGARTRTEALLSADRFGLLAQARTSSPPSPQRRPLARA